MKTLLPKRVKDVLTAALSYYELNRVVCEELAIGVCRYYVCGMSNKGIFAAWNDAENFNRFDIVFFDNIDDAWDFINKPLSGTL